MSCPNLGYYCMNSAGEAVSSGCEPQHWKWWPMGCNLYGADHSNTSAYVCGTLSRSDAGPGCSNLGWGGTNWLSDYGNTNTGLEAASSALKAASDLGEIAAFTPHNFYAGAPARYHAAELALVRDDMYDPHW